MAGENQNANVPESVAEGNFKLELKGGIPSGNRGEEFVRVDFTRPGKFGMIDRRTGFIPVAEGHSAELIKAVQEKQLLIKLGSKTRNGVYNITTIDPTMEGVEITEEETTLQHSA